MIWNWKKNIESVTGDKSKMTRAIPQVSKYRLVIYKFIHWQSNRGEGRLLRLILKTQIL